MEDLAATAADPSGLPGRPALVRGVILARVVAIWVEFAR